MWLNLLGKGEPALLGLDFYKQAVEYQQEFAQGKQIKRLSNQWHCS